MSAKLWRLGDGHAASRPHCVPQWQLGELAARVRSANAQELSHLATCTACSDAYASFRTAIAESRHEALPAHVRAALCVARDRSHWAARSWVWTLLLPTLASFVWLVAAAPAFSTPPPGPQHVAALTGTVQRNQQVVQSSVPLEQLGDLHAGDQIHLEVVGASEHWVAVQGWEDPRWETYFSGRVPPAGRLPVAVGVSDAGETRLRLWVCSEQPAAGSDYAGCDARLYTF